MEDAGIPEESQVREGGGGIIVLGLLLLYRFTANTVWHTCNSSTAPQGCVDAAFT